MTAPAPHAPAATGGRLPGPFIACLAYTVRVCVPPKRWALLAVPTVGAVLFGLLARVIAEPLAERAFAFVSIGLFSLVLPFAALVVGDAVLGAERRSGALTLTFLSPVPLATIVAARWLAGWGITLVALVPAMAAAALVAGAPASVGPVVIATVAGTSAYVAQFLLVGIVTQRAALWSLGIVLLAERLVGTALDGIAQLSPQWLARTAFADLAPNADELLRDGVPSGWGAVVRLAIITVVLLALSTWRLRHLHIGGPTD